MSQPPEAEPGDADGEPPTANAYTAEARELFSLAIVEFTDDLDKVSERLRRRRRTDVISAVDVDRALEALGVRARTPRQRTLSIVGSLLAGGAAGYLIQVSAEGADGKPVAGILGVVALFAVAGLAVFYGEKD